MPTIAPTALIDTVQDWASLPPLLVLLAALVALGLPLIRLAFAPAGPGGADRGARTALLLILAVVAIVAAELFTPMRGWLGITLLAAVFAAGLVAVVRAMKAAAVREEATARPPEPGMTAGAWCVAVLLGFVAAITVAVAAFLLLGGDGFMEMASMQVCAVLAAVVVGDLSANLLLRLRSRTRRAELRPRGLTTVLSLRAAGLDNRIICMDGPYVPALRAAGIPVHTVHLPRGVDPVRLAVAVVEIARYLRRERIQIVHTHCFIPGVAGRIAARLAGAEVIIHTVHGFDAHVRTAWPLRTVSLGVERACGLLTDALLTQSREDLDLAKRHRVGPAGSRHRIGNGIDLDRFRPPPTPKPPGGPVVITCVARLEPVKNHRMLLEAVALLERRRADFRLRLVGDGPLRKRYQRLCRRLGIDDVVEFLGYRDDIPMLLAESDIAVLTSLKEGIPRAVMEAMAMGLPVVATHVPGTKELVRDLETGITVLPGDKAGLAAALAHLVADPTARSRLGRNGRAVAIEDFDERAVVRSLRDLYLARLEARAGHRPVRFGPTRPSGAEHPAPEPSSGARIVEG